MDRDTDLKRMVMAVFLGNIAAFGLIAAVGGWYLRSKADAIADRVSSIASDLLSSPASPSSNGGSPSGGIGGGLVDVFMSSAMDGIMGGGVGMGEDDEVPTMETGADEDDGGHFSERVVDDDTDEDAADS